jgi:hypothetical protein
MNKDDLKGKAENLKERAKEAVESIGKRRSSEGEGHSASPADRGSSVPGGKSAAGDSAGSRRADSDVKAVEPEDLEDAAGDVDPEIEESEDD